MAALGVLCFLVGDSPQGLDQQNSIREGGGGQQPHMWSHCPNWKGQWTLCHPASSPSQLTAMGGAMSTGPTTGSPALASGDCPGHSH